MAHSYTWDTDPLSGDAPAMALTMEDPLYGVGDSLWPRHNLLRTWAYENADSYVSSQARELSDHLERTLRLPPVLVMRTTRMPEKPRSFGSLDFIKHIDLWTSLNTSIKNVKFFVSSSKMGGLDIEIGSSIVHIPNHCSMQNRAVQMLLYAKKTNAQHTFRCPRSLARRAILDIVEKSSPDERSTDLPILAEKPEEEECILKNQKAYALATTQSPTPSDSNCSSLTGNLAPVILLDSGATHHVAGDAGILTDLHDPPAECTVVMADGFELPVDKVGVIQTPDIVIPDVYFVPGLQVNLVSVRQLAKNKVVTTFHENHAELWRDGEQVGGAIVDNDASLYRLCFFKPRA